MNLLTKLTLNFSLSDRSLFSSATNFPIDILFVRDDDIPVLVKNGIADLGIVGENVLLEYTLSNPQNTLSTILAKLGFGRCRLSIAVPSEMNFKQSKLTKNFRIATSYPSLLKQYLEKNNCSAEIITLSGSCEIAPKLNLSDAICDLVSSGQTLKDNQLKEVKTILNSEAVLIQSPTLSSKKQSMLQTLFNQFTLT